MPPVQGIQIFVVDEARNQNVPKAINTSGNFWLAKLPYGQEAEADNGKDHLDERVGAEANGAQDEQLDQLAGREQVDFALGHSPDVVGGGIGLLQ